MRCKVTALLRNIKHFREVSFPGLLISLCRTSICAPAHRAFALARIYIYCIEPEQGGMQAFGHTHAPQYGQSRPAGRR